jgi:hypothetical protein
VRELDRAGWRVGLGTPHRGTFADRSRAVGARHRVRLPGTLDDLVTDVTRAVDEGGYEVVLGAGDDWLVALARAAPALAVTVAHPSSDAVAVAVDKVELGHRCAEVGLSTPLTWPGDVAPPPGPAPPYVVKAREHGPVDRPGGRPVTALVTSLDDLGRATANLTADGHRPVVQEALAGRLMALSGVLHEGRLVARVQQVAEATWPLPVGVSCRARTVPVDRHLAGRVQALLRDIGWTGMAEVQFLEPTGGPPHLIDLNGRPYGSLALARAAGVRLVDTTVRAALGLPLTTVRDGSSGVRYQWLEGDLRRAWQEGRGGRSRDVLRTAAASLWSTHSVWDRHDPAPLLRTRVADPLLRRASHAG